MVAGWRGVVMRALTPRDVDLLRRAGDGRLREQREALVRNEEADPGECAELDDAVRELVGLGLLDAQLSPTPAGVAVLARRDELVTLTVTAEMARWLARWLHNLHHELRGRDGELALDVRDAATLAVLNHEHGWVTPGDLAGAVTGGAGGAL